MATPIKNGLLVQRALSNRLLALLNGLYRPQRADLPPNPRKILLCNLGHLGDVVTSTAVLPPLKKKYPRASIGFLTSSDSRIALQGHPLIDEIHLKTQCKAALHCYDLAIDLHPYFPNAIPLLAKAKIKARIGYPTGGFGNLLTHRASWHFHDRYVGYAHLNLLKILGIDVSSESPLPHYPFPTRPCHELVIHMGSSSERKEWRLEHWISLIQKLQADGHQILLTGKGEREKKMCEEAALATKAQNLCDQLSWQAFVSLLQSTPLLITVDTATTHIAAAASAPTLVIWSGINAPAMWLPPTPLCKSVMHPMPCAPCFQKRGCPSMSCIQKISVDQVYKEAQELLCKKF